MRKKRPVEYLAGGFVLGELTGLTGISLGTIAAAAAVAELFMMWKETKRGKFMSSLASFCEEIRTFSGICRHFLWPVLFVFMGILGRWRMENVQEEPERVLMDGETAVVCGRVSWCEEREDGIRITVERGTAEQGERMETGDWYIYGGEWSHLVPGNQIRAVGTFSYPKGATNPGQFDYEKYCKGIGIRGQLAAEQVEVLAEEEAGLKALFQKIRRICYTSLYRLKKEDRGLIAAMVLGNRRGIEAEEYDRFLATGTAHILSISAMHLSLVGYSLYRLLSLLGVWPLVRCILPIGAVWFYALFSGSSPSGIRAAIMFSFMMVGKWLGRTYDLRCGMAVAAFLMFWENPLAMTLTGVQYSFAALAGIGFLLPKLKAVTERKKDGLLLNLAVFLAILPIQCKYSFEFSPWTLAVNGLMVPTMGILLAGSFLGCLGTVVSPWIGTLFFSPVGIILWLYRRICLIPEIVPFGMVLTGEPSAAGIVLYGVSLFLILKAAEQKKRRLLLLVMLPVFLMRPPEHDLSVHFLDVGQGDCTVICCPGGETFVIDGGSTSEEDVYGNRIEPFLKSRRIRKVDVAAATHMDRDHISGLMDLLSGDIRVTELLLPSRKEPEQKAEQLKQEAGRWHEIGKGEVFTMGEVRITCLAPEQGADGLDENDYSLVLMLEYGDFRFLFTGDLGEQGEKRLLEQGLLKDADVLKVAHHGSGSSTSEAFLRSVRPELAVISCGQGNVYGHPHEETLLRLQEAGCQVLTTPDCGAITIREQGVEKRMAVYYNEKIRNQ